MRPNPVLSQALYGQDLKQDLKCCPSFRGASTGVGTLRTLATTCLSRAHTNWSIGATDPPRWFYLRSRAASRSKPLGWGLSSLLSFSSSHTPPLLLLLLLLPPPPPRCLWIGGQLIRSTREPLRHPRAKQVWDSSLRPLTDPKRDFGPQSLPACGALVSRQDEADTGRHDTTAPD